MDDKETAKFSPVSHVIFDCDGLLLDTEKIYSKAISSVTERCGKPYTWDVRVKVLGQTYTGTASTIIKELQLPYTVDEFIALEEEVAKELFPKAELLPGAEKLVRHLHKHNIPIAIATSSRRSTFELKTQHHQDFLKLFSHVVWGSDDPEVKAGKPAPDTFLVCSDRFKDKPPPEKVLVFEDSPNGVEAAAAAGMQVVMVPDPRVGKELCEKATIALKSLEDFQPELFGLPPYDC